VSDEQSETDFVAEWDQWHRAREDRLASPHGFLAITGLHWLRGDPERFRDAPGAWSSTIDGVDVELADGEELIVNDGLVTGHHRFHNVDEHGTRKVAEEYLKYLYSPQGQEIVARHFYRPRDPHVAAEHAAQFASIARLVTIDAVFGGWAKAQATHFADHGTFDKIYGQ